MKKARIYGMVIIFCIQNSVAVSEKKQLTKIDYHQDFLVDTLGCYFSDEPLVVYEPDLWSKKISLFIPHINSTRKIMRTIQHINTLSADHYKITISFTEKPVIGMRICITFNQDEINFSYSQDAVFPEKGLVLSFAKKQKLKKLNGYTAVDRLVA